MNKQYIAHYGVPGMQKGVRRWTNDDGTLTEEGKIHYGIGLGDDQQTTQVPTEPTEKKSSSTKIEDLKFEDHSISKKIQDSKNANITRAKEHKNDINTDSLWKEANNDENALTTFGENLDFMIDYVSRSENFKNLKDGSDRLNLLTDTLYDESFGDKEFFKYMVSQIARDSRGLGDIPDVKNPSHNAKNSSPKSTKKRSDETDDDDVHERELESMLTSEEKKQVAQEKKAANDFLSDIDNQLASLEKSHKTMDSETIRKLTQKIKPADRADFYYKLLNSKVLDDKTRYSIFGQYRQSMLGYYAPSINKILEDASFYAYRRGKSKSFYESVSLDEIRDLNKKYAEIHGTRDFYKKLDELNSMYKPKYEKIRQTYYSRLIDALYHEINWQNDESAYTNIFDMPYVAHTGVKGMKWGVRKYQDKDGKLTEAGKKAYLYEKATHDSELRMKESRQAFEQKKALREQEFKHEKARRQGKRAAAVSLTLIGTMAARQLITSITKSKIQIQNADFANQRKLIAETAKNAVKK